MGLFDIFKKQDNGNTFDSFSNLKNCRIYIFLKGGNLSEVKAQMDEYHEIYITEAAFSTQLYKLGDTQWTYVALTLLPDVAELSPVWEYFNILLWMSDKAESSFAYAFSDQKGELPLIAERDWNNQYGDSCNGIANGKYFYAAVPDQNVTWNRAVPNQFDYEGYLREKYGVDVRQAI